MNEQAAVEWGRDRKKEILRRLDQAKVCFVCIDRYIENNQYIKRYYGGLVCDF